MHRPLGGGPSAAAPRRRPLAGFLAGQLPAGYPVATGGTRVQSGGTRVPWMRFVEVCFFIARDDISKIHRRT